MRLQVLDPVHVRLLRDRIGDVLTDLVGVRHEALRALEALVFEEVLQVEMPADVGEVTAGLQHHQRDEPAVGRPEVPDSGIDRDVRGRGELGWRAHLVGEHCRA